MKWSDRLARDEWNLGIVDQTIDDIARRGICQPVRWFPKNSFQILADPFCLVSANGTVTIMAERVNHWIGQGEIYTATISKNDNPVTQRFEHFLTAMSHLSYPFVINDGSNRYMTLESHEAQALFLWRCNGAQLQYAKTLFNRPTCDATIYQDANQRWWLFCTFQDDESNERLHLFYADSLLGDWIPHPMNPIKQDRSNARPAGALFTVDGMLMRPAQDCSHTYGGRLVINHVVTLTTEAYEETPFRIIEPQSDYYCDGIHTIAAAGDYTVIDGKRWHRGPGTVACRITAKLVKWRRRQRLRTPFRVNEFLQTKAG